MLPFWTRVLPSALASAAFELCEWRLLPSDTTSAAPLPGDRLTGLRVLAERQLMMGAHPAEKRAGQMD